MQYLVSVIDDKTGSATPDEMVAVDAFNDPATGRVQGLWGRVRASLTVRLLGLEVAKE